MAVAAPREREAVVEEGLAEIDDALLAHGEQVVDEDDVAHAALDQHAAQPHDVLDAVHAALAARGGAVAERARERAAARGDQRRHRRARIAEQRRLEAVREVRQQIPGRQRQRVEIVDVRRARVGAHARRRGDRRGPATSSTGDARSPGAPAGRTARSRPRRRRRSRCSETPSSVRSGMALTCAPPRIVTTPGSSAFTRVGDARRRW